MAIAGEFRRRAFHEARRYGADAWVFVRELLQNSRDAGASRVDFTVERRNGVDRIVCRDDGCGMSFEHARKYLFTLYASSKQNQNDAAGRFGIGFWAVLRFEPDQVFVRSSPPGESGWEIRLSGDLETIERSKSFLTAGTEIELVRSAGDVDPVRAVWDAIQRDARHLRRRDSGNEILDVRVNSKVATAEIELEPPTLGFSRSGLTGAVALADRPQVDLLAHGLRVRTTATLDELLTGPDRRRRRRSGNPEGLVPRVILDSRRLQVLMARADARTDRELRRLVATGRRGVRRLVRGQLDREAGLGSIGRATMRLRELVSTGWVRKAAVALAAGVVLIAGLWWLAELSVGGTRGFAGRGPGIAALNRSDPGEVLRLESADRYRGPAADPLDLVPARVSLRYEPSRATPMLAIFRVIGLTDDGRVAPGPTSSGPRPYLGSGCSESCLEIALDLDGMAGAIRLPVPTGHLLDPSSLTVVGGSAALRAAADGGPLLVVEDSAGSVSYRTGPAAEIQVVAGSSWPDLPEPANSLAFRLRGLAADEVAASARDWVRKMVVYDTSARTVEEHRVAAREGLPFAQRCLAVGAGDCDVQNSLLAALIARAGVPARLAVGFVGADGRALPGLHAWVEYRGEHGMWRAVDASRGPAVQLGEATPAEVGETEDLTDVGATAAATLASHPNSRFGSLAVVGMVLTVGLLAIAALWMVRRRMVVHQIRSTDVPDLAGLLRGALARPEAYREVPALFSRGVIPSLGGSPISLDRAQTLARQRRLAVSVRSSPLALRAVEAGRPVIDGSRSEGQAVAAALGAIDLDRWSEIIDRGCEHPLSQRLVEAASGVGETWDVIVVVDLSQEIAVLDGTPAGLDRRRRVVAVDDGGALWKRVLRLGRSQPCTATLLLADRLTERLRMSSICKRRLLSKLAAEAVVERVESCP